MPHTPTGLHHLSRVSLLLLYCIRLLDIPTESLPQLPLAVIFCFDSRRGVGSMLQRGTSHFLKLLNIALSHELGIDHHPLMMGELYTRPHTRDRSKDRTTIDDARMRRILDHLEKLMLIIGRAA